MFSWTLTYCFTRICCILKYLIKLCIFKWNKIKQTQCLYRCSPMFSAIEHGHLEVIKVLVSNRANLELKNKCGETPFMYCVKYGKEDIVKYLGDKNVEVNIQDKECNSSLHLATSNADIRMVKLLLDLDISIDLRNQEDETAIDIAKKHDSEDMKDVVELLRLKQIEHKKVKSFLFACQYGDVEEAKKKADIDIDAKNPDGDTALILATRAGKVGLCRFLLSEGSNIDHQNRKGQTALHIAVQKRNIKLVSELLLKFPKLLPDMEGVTPIDVDSTISIQTRIQQYKSENPEATQRGGVIVYCLNIF